MLKRFITLLALLGMLLPLAVQASATMESKGFVLDNINFASNYALITSVDGKPPAISSEGPTVIELKPNQATISWRTDKESGSSINYGTSNGYGLQNGSTDRVTTHTVTIYDLKPETTYHYQVVSVDLQGNKGTSSDHTFSTPAENTITSIQISDVGYDHALVRWTTGNFTSSKLEYGTSLRYGSTLASASLGFTTDHTVQLTGLSPGTSYHVRITAENQQGAVTLSSDFGFTTLANPSVTGVSVSTSSPNVATLLWSTNTLTTGVIRVDKKGGDSTDSQSLGDSALLINHQTVIEHLQGDSDYTVSIIATDTGGRQATSAAAAFHTPTDSIPPKIDGLKVAVNRSGSSLVMTATWTTDEPATSEAELVPKSGGKGIKLPTQSSFGTDHVMSQADLSSATSYELTVISKDPFGNTSKQSISFVSPTIPKGILTLLLESIQKAFGWIGRL